MGYSDALNPPAREIHHNHCGSSNDSNHTNKIHTHQEGNFFTDHPGHMHRACYWVIRKGSQGEDPPEIIKKADIQLGMFIKLVSAL